MIGRKSILILISFIITRFLQAIVYLVAVNYFLPLDFGYYQIATSIMAIFLLITELGFKMAHVKMISDKKDESECFTIFFLIKVILTIISSFFIFLLILYQRNIGLIPENENLNWIFLIIFSYQLLNTFSTIYESSFRAKMNAAKMQLPIIIGTVFGTIFSLISIIVLHNFYLYLIGNALSSLIKLVFFLYYGRIFHFKPINVELLKKYISLNFIFIFPLVFMSLRVNLGPLFFLRYYDEEILGIYMVLSNLFLIIKGFQNTFRTLLIPNFSNLILNDKIENLRISFRLFEKYMTIFNGIIIIGGLFFAEIFIKEFLGEIYYDTGIYLFFGFLFALLNIPLSGAYPSLLVALGKLKFYTFIEAFIFIFSILSWIFLIPTLNIIGIEFGIWFSIIPISIITRIYCNKKINIGKMEKRQLLHYFILILILIVTYIIIIKQIALIYSIILFFIIVSIYIFMLFVFKILNRKDIKYLLDVINPGKMINYVRDEAFN